MSRRIENLEERLRTQWFQRGKQGAALTDVGARFLSAAEQLQYLSNNELPGHTSNSSTTQQLECHARPSTRTGRLRATASRLDCRVRARPYARAQGRN
ncbi:MAG TPA: hypothetical protein EYG46_03640 [Myxococcales bacterium]|nr:hypothetical protein [Myxococcales bacterium]HIM00073.1 hypothetical protein [Myxococcales bacterium]